MTAFRALAAGLLSLAVPPPSSVQPANADQPERIIAPRVRPAADGKRPPATTPNHIASVDEQIRTREVLLQILSEIKRIRIDVEANSWGRPAEDKP